MSLLWSKRHNDVLGSLVSCVCLYSKRGDIDCLGCGSSDLSTGGALFGLKSHRYTSKRTATALSRRFLLPLTVIIIIMTALSSVRAEEVLPPAERTIKPKKGLVESGWDLLFDEKSSALWRPLRDINAKARRRRRPPVAEVFTGSDVTENQAGFYAGGVTGALDPHINLYGFKLRAVYGRSFYQYRSKLKFSAGEIDALFLGESQFYEAMLGYEFRFQDVIFKAYGGMVHEVNHIDPNDAENKLQGDLTGAKALLEVWREFDGGHWFSGYGAYTTSTEYYTIHGRLGMPVTSFIHVGLEAGSFGNQQFDALRLGAFGKLKLGDGELTISGGVSGDYEQPDSLYGSVQYFTKLYTPIEWGSGEENSENEDEADNKTLWDLLFGW